MKKITLLIVMLGLAFSMMAQRNNAPTLFRSHADYVQYQLDHPDRVPVKAMENHRFLSEYSQKLDSVVGFDDFDRSRWKNVYVYGDLRKETHFEWKDNAWLPVSMTESLPGEEHDTTFVYQWNEDEWDLTQRVSRRYRICDQGKLLEELVAERPDDSAWVGSSRSVYEYDEANNLLLNMNYSGVNNNGAWRESSKTVYSYNEAGLLTKRLYSTYRNGSWRESSKDSLIYDEQQRCVQLVVSNKFSWGGNNSWRVSGKYEINYNEDNQVESETVYAGSWFGSEMTLESKTGYSFDANGNEVLKTGSVFNGTDWIVRDVYENTFDNTVKAESVLGLAEIWQSTLDGGMGYVLGQEMPLNNCWLSCSVVSQDLDTHFNLYCSGFAGVEESQAQNMRVSVSQGRLTVENDAPADVMVFDMLGRTVASRKAALQSSFELRPGLYLVGNGTNTLKVVVH